MELKLHRNARTTPAIRRFIRESELTNAALARKLNLGVATIKKWRSRAADNLHDLSSRPHNMQTSLLDWQEDIVVEIRKDMMLPVDDLLVVVRCFFKEDMSRSSLLRLLERRGVGSLRKMIAEQNPTPKKKYKTFKDYDPGFLHVDVKYLPKMPDEESRQYLFVARDRASRWVYIAIKPNKTAECAADFLQEVKKDFLGDIKIILTDNGKEFTDRFCATGERKPTGNHLFDKACTDNNIEHRLTKPFSPQTNGMKI
jgi:transposase-like protein